MAWKNSYSVEITTGAGYTVTADDAVTEGVGASAYAMITEGKDLHIQTATGGVLIPFHAVDHAVYTLTRSQVADPTDPTCV